MKRKNRLCSFLALLLLLTPLSVALRADDILHKKDGTEYLGRRKSDQVFMTCEDKKVTIEKGDTVKPTDQTCHNTAAASPAGRPAPTPPPKKKG